MDVCMSRHEIRRLRKSKKLNQAQFAALFHCSTITIRRWESGKAVPNYEKQAELLAIKEGHREGKIQGVKAVDLLELNSCRYGLAIRRLRVLRGMSVNELALRASELGEPFVRVTVDYVWSVEKGYMRVPSPAKLSVIIAALGVTEKEFKKVLDEIDGNKSK